MIIRHFEIKDIKALQKYRYPEKNDLEILSMINEWNIGNSSGRYFEMFTASHGGQAVGEVSIYEHTEEQFPVTVLSVRADARRRIEKPPTIELIIDKSPYVLATGIGNAARLRLRPHIITEDSLQWVAHFVI
jgi:hypothetical protein